MIDNLLELAVKIKASDIHLTVNTEPCLRIDGEIYRISETPVYEEMKAKCPELAGILEVENIMAVIKELLEGTNIALDELYQKKNLDLAYEDCNGRRFRVNIFLQHKKPAVALRVLSNVVPTIDELFGNFPNVAAKMYDFAKLPHGLILVTGPTGSGKSTTLAAIINAINSTMRKHIITLEDPIEYVHPHKMSIVNQREIGRDAISFIDGLRAALREDPDVILVGEMRDLETVKIAMQAANTGHLVLSTLHTNTASETVERIINMFSGDEQTSARLDFSEAIQAVISQRLVKKKNGGRVPAVEIMVATPAIRNCIREGKTYQIVSAIQTGKEEGMQLMEKSLSELIRQGLVTKEEALSKTTNKKLINQYFG